MTNSHELAEHFAEMLETDFEFETPGLGDPLEIKAVVKSVTKAQDITGLMVHVIPLAPECQTEDRGGGISAVHNVAILIINKREAGASSVSETLFQWQKKHAAAVIELITAGEWQKWIKQVSGSAVLTEVDTSGITFDGVDASTVFAQVVVFTVEDSE